MYRRFPRGMYREQIRAKRTRLERCEPRCCTSKRDVGRGFSLKHLPNENEFAALEFVADAVADHAFAQHRRQLRRKVTYLVGMRKQDQIRLGGFDDLLQRHAKTIRRVSFEQIMLDA